MERQRVGGTVGLGYQRQVLSGILSWVTPSQHTSRFLRQAPCLLCSRIGYRSHVCLKLTNGIVLGVWAACKASPTPPPAHSHSKTNSPAVTFLSGGRGRQD